MRSHPARHVTFTFNRRTNLLSQLCDDYGSDKGSVNGTSNFYPWPSHSYTEYYARKFDGSRTQIRNVFECGIGATGESGHPAGMGKNYVPGASLRVWRDYFPNAHIYGIDIDPETMFAEDRISTHIVDQTSSKAVDEYFRTVGVTNFDLMIDDGLHEYEAAISLFEGAIQNLAENGTYVIEDVSPQNLSKLVTYFEKRAFNADVIRFSKKRFSRIGDNSLLAITGGPSIPSGRARGTAGA